MSVTAQIEGDFIEAATALKAHFGHSPEFIDRVLLRLKGEVYASLDWETACESAAEQLIDEFDDRSLEHYLGA